jgi:hypothetical protein
VCWQHPFIASVSDNRPLLELLAEAKAEVTEVNVVEEEPDELNIYVSFDFLFGYLWLTFLGPTNCIWCSIRLPLKRLYYRHVC